MSKLNLTVTSAFGIEAVTKRELIKLGIDNPRAINGRFHFSGDFNDVAKLNMFLRTADRVLIELAKFKATTFDELYDGTFAVNWQDIISKNGFIHVIGKSKNSQLFAVSSCQSICKKAIVEKMKKTLNTSFLSETGSEYLIEVAINNNIVTLNLDTTGKGLHKRGYRDLVVDAPIKETLASAIIDLSVYKYDRPLIDPFCGSGTFAIEAARKELNIASGIDRDFMYMYWDNIDKKYYDNALTEAKDLIKLDRKLRINAYDIDNRAIKLARHHAENARVSDYIHFQCMDMREVSSRYSHGVIIANPPYGERMMSYREIKELYTDFGKMYRNLDEWCLYSITSYRNFEKDFGKKATKTRKLYNGKLECKLYQYLAKKPQKNNMQNIL